MGWDTLFGKPVDAFKLTPEEKYDILVKCTPIHLPSLPVAPLSPGHPVPLPTGCFKGSPVIGNIAAPSGDPITVYMIRAASEEILIAEILKRAAENNETRARFCIELMDLWGEKHDPDPKP